MEDKLDRHKEHIFMLNVYKEGKLDKHMMRRMKEMRSNCYGY